jgi:hypothetical protein
VARPPKAEPSFSREPEKLEPAAPRSRPAEKRGSERPGRARSPANRVAIALLLAVGLMVGFWLLFRLPGTVSHGQH